jgi:hypothetical protein
MRGFARFAALAVAASGVGLLASPAAHAVPGTGPSLTFANYACSAGVCSGSDSVMPTTTDFDALVDIPQFDSSLGTLTSITITITGQMNATGSVTNTSDSNATGVVLTQNSTITDNPAGQPVGGSFGAVTVTGNNGGDSFLTFATSAAAGSAVGTVAGGATDSGISLDDPFTAVTLSESSAFDANLLGTGVFAINIATGEYTSIGGSGGNLTSSVSTEDGISVSVTYDYTAACGTGPGQSGVACAVPEPASMSLLGFGLVSLGALVRRRRRS